MRIVIIRELGGGEACNNEVVGLRRLFIRRYWGGGRLVIKM